MPHLANRLAVYICKDLAAHAPRSFNALHNWLTHSGFWLAELSACPRTPDQIQCMIGFLGLALVREHTDYSLPQACQMLREHMTLHLLTKEQTS